MIIFCCHVCVSRFVAGVAAGRTSAQLWLGRARYMVSTSYLMTEAEGGQKELFDQTNISSLVAMLGSTTLEPHVTCLNHVLAPLTSKWIQFKFSCFNLLPCRRHKIIIVCCMTAGRARRPSHGTPRSCSTLRCVCSASRWAPRAASGAWRGGARRTRVRLSPGTSTASWRLTCSSGGDCSTASR